MTLSDTDRVGTLVRRVKELGLPDPVATLSDQLTWHFARGGKLSVIPWGDSLAVKTDLDGFASPWIPLHSVTEVIFHLTRLYEKRGRP